MLHNVCVIILQCEPLGAPQTARLALKFGGWAQQGTRHALRRLVWLLSSTAGCYKALGLLTAARLVPELGGWAL